MRRNLLLACLTCATLTATAVAQPPADSRLYRETGQFVAEGVFRGFAIPGVAAQQHDKAVAVWKRMYEKDTPVSVETYHFLVYSTMPPARLTEIGQLLEKTYVLAMKALEMDQAGPWAGKLAVFVVEDRGEFTTLHRFLAKRRAPDEDQAVFDVEGELPHVLAGPPLAGSFVTAGQAAGAQVGAALLYRLTGNKAPHWAQLGFGRATVFQASPLKDRGAEYRRVAALARTKKGLKEALGAGSLDLEDAAAVQASLMHYLAYSGRTAKFLPFVKGFQATEDMPQGTLQQALDAANVSLDQLDKVWQAWAKTLK